MTSDRSFPAHFGFWPARRRPRASLRSRCKNSFDAPGCRSADTVAVMSSCVGRRAKRRAKLLGLTATILIVSGMALGGPAAPAAADWNQCAPGGLDSARLLPKDLTEHPATADDDRETTATVQPLSSVDVGALGLGTGG